MKEKITEMDKVRLVNYYLQYIKENGTVGDEYNKVFFRRMQILDAFSILKANQIRMILVNRGVYKPTNPRVEAKKKGINKTELITQLRELCKDELTDSILKINMTDLEILIKNIQPAE